MGGGIPMIRILIIEDQMLLCDTLMRALTDNQDFEIAGASECADQALELCKTCNPDIILMDIYTRSGNGIEAAKTIKAQMPHVKVLILSAFGDENNIQSAMDAGADGYVLKDIQLGELISIIQDTMQKYRIFPAQKETGKAACQSKAVFSETELNIISLLMEGKTAREISELLFLSHGTVRNYISRMLLRYGFKDRLQLVLFAANEGCLAGERPGKLDNR